MARGDIVLVDSLAALQDMRRHIFEEDPAGPLHGVAYNTDAPGSEPLQMVINHLGWQGPALRAQAKTCFLLHLCLNTYSFVSP